MADADPQTVLAALWRASLPTPLDPIRRTYLAAVTEDYLTEATGLHGARLRDALQLLSTDGIVTADGTHRLYAHPDPVRMFVLSHHQVRS
ncbi:hypothetical protein [Allobranchiibius huperziae]|uniref:Uncharacterized protein n=1 Tax=Allobranchiibius huperziae TaxID=1874116 RepID=A0A853DR34_9MICO|nr:hypothetical protein [Allobranchiibius huperziae]NYJ76585.1 hypothetical protein [Allobranchiibius huperziae]